MSAPADASRARVALATVAELPEGIDEQRLADELGATWAVWDDPAVDWDAFDLVVVRSIWDYSQRLEEFLAWTRAVPRLANPADVLAWNSDKRYLEELAGAGLPTVETRLLAPDETLDDDDPLLAGELVVKPTVSAGARDTSRFAPGEHERRTELLERIHGSGRTAMVQPFVASVDARGESALLLFDGRFSHAIEKGRILEPGADPIVAQGHLPEIRAYVPTADERAVAERAIAVVAERFGTVPLYARVDLVASDDGRPLLLELELTEPYLFLDHAETATRTFADAIRARAGAR
jgi:glutathione synthase/RimK-type ligase-like ATP-grasp enzyme